MILQEEAARLKDQREARREQERQAALQRQGPEETPRSSGAGAGSNHPERFLNQLSPKDQGLFLEHFSVLSLEQQTYAYNMFLSTPPEIQRFAISQFLSLTPEVLIVSIQAEIDREAALVAEASAPQFQPRPVAATYRAQFTVSSRHQLSAVFIP